jgi:hypothetical protein
MNYSRILYRWLSCAVPCLGGILLCCGLAAPIYASADQPAIAAQKIQHQVGSIDARFKRKKPFLERAVDEGTEGSDVFAWGAPGAIEKISVKYQGERGELLQDSHWQKGVLIAVRQRKIDYGAYTMELPDPKRRPRKVLEDDRYEFAGEVVLRKRSFGRAMPTDNSGSDSTLEELKVATLSYKRLMDLPETKENKYGNCTWSCTQNKGNECLAYSCK